MNQSVFEIAKRILRDAWDKRLFVTILYAFTSIAFLVLALNWPRIFTSNSIVFVDKQNIMSQLLGKNAALTSAVDHTKNAREVVFSRVSSKRILDSISWFEKEATAAEKEMKIESIRKRTDFVNLGIT